MNKIKLGLIIGRHPLPVDSYIITDDITEYTKDALEPLVVEGLMRNGLEPDKYINGWSVDGNEHALEIDLYLTGLTIVSLVAVNVLNRWGYTVNVVGFNPICKEYYSQGTFRAKDFFEPGNF